MNITETVKEIFPKQVHQIIALPETISRESNFWQHISSNLANLINAYQSI